MQLLQLPLDVFRALLQVTVQELGLLESVRLRLVSRMFFHCLSIDCVLIVDRCFRG